MKVPSLLAVAAAAGLGLVSAAPIRVIMVEIHRGPPPADQVFPSAIRFGHPAAGRLPQDFGVPIPVRPKGGRPHHDCGGGFRNKVNHISNMWRKMLGLETTPEGPHHSLPRPGPPPFMNFHGPLEGVPTPSAVEGEFHALPIYSAVPYPSEPTFVKSMPHPHPHPHRQRHSNFFGRLGHALTLMGPWEGRALSFVLGCGIGVILRMFFVFGVLAFRARRCRRSIALPADEVVFVAEVAEYVEEKAPVPVETTTSTPAST